LTYRPFSKHKSCGQLKIFHSMSIPVRDRTRCGRHGFSITSIFLLFPPIFANIERVESHRILVFSDQGLSCSISRKCPLQPVCQFETLFPAPDLQIPTKSPDFHCALVKVSSDNSLLCQPPSSSDIETVEGSSRLQAICMHVMAAANVEAVDKIVVPRPAAGPLGKR